MDGYHWLQVIKKQRPKYAGSREDLIKRFANKGSSKSDYVQFGPIYQLYMYVFMLGFHRGERIPLPDRSIDRKEFRSMDDWRPDGMVDYLLMILFAHSPSRKEAGIDFGRMQDLEDEEVDRAFKKLIRIMEEYANAGFGILEAQFKNDPYYFNDSFAFTLLLKEIAEGKIPQ